MIKNPLNKGYYSEEYDGEALQELAEMAKSYVGWENGIPNPRMKFDDSIPGGGFSDFSCTVWSIFTGAVRYGMELQKMKEGS